MIAAGFKVRVTSLALVLSCGGGSSGSPGRPIVIPEVAPGAHEASCQDLCTRSAGDTICTAKHTEFCVARCRASTRSLPAPCADCLIAAGTKIEGYTNGVGDKYCTVGGAAELSACPAACDDGVGQPAPELETLCQLYCSFYVQAPNLFACSAPASADCLAACRMTIAARGRACAQCLTEQTRPGSSCINDDCDCLNSWDDSTAFGCRALCDATPPM